ncbi:MAG: hypothetical protein DRO87_06985 [Candidatus Thorarchaeota archaeon]|nr:MAG: hypothetical protein DRP09_08955 [Candidatus Thorarchaeota archaeon]RLI57406.1 MAG: hypothetical protein DRO87_06985 [Candidatus Thorarchaeota archaeon]
MTAIQSVPLIQLVALILIVFGIVAVVAGILQLFLSNQNEDGRVHHESKGIILLGPIPIVWGYGKKGWILAGAVAIILFLILTLMPG